MEVRYYVMRAGAEFRVMREGKPKGQHATQDEALRSAMFMASIESEANGSEIFLEDDAGRLQHELTIGPVRKPPARLLLQVGDETVFA
jgi:hypothetical protein